MSAGNRVLSMSWSDMLGNHSSPAAALRHLGCSPGSTVFEVRNAIVATIRRACPEAMFWELGDVDIELHAEEIEQAYCKAAQELLADARRQIGWRPLP